MAENSKIEWTDHTFNPWRGCTKISPGCANCYAETLSQRNPAQLGQWGQGKPRVLASEAMWQKPLKWNKHAAECKIIGGKLYRQWGSSQSVGRPETLVILASDPKGCTHEIKPEEWKQAQSYRPRVFCASLADWLDNEVPLPWLIRLLSLIAQTRRLDWLLLTKRLENLRPRMEAVMRYFARNNVTNDEALARVMAEAWLTTGGTILDNVWLGTTVEDQARADERIPLLLSLPAKVRFLSCEPLLGAVNISEIRDAEGFEYMPLVGAEKPEPRIHWVICGGESGPKARPMHPDWARSLRDQCAQADTPFFFKQWGEFAPCPIGDGPDLVTDAVFKKGPGHDGAVWQVGKAKAGRLLDGAEHNGYPTLEGRAA